MPAPPTVRKTPWELHAIACLVAVFLGYAVSQRGLGHLDWIEWTIVGALPVLTTGLFRGRKLAWWSSVLLFSVLSFLLVGQSIDLVRGYGFRRHWFLLQTHFQSITFVAALGLLISCRLRKAFPSPSRDLWGDARVVGRGVAIAAPVLILAATVWSFGVVFLFASGRYYGERSVATSMKVLASAEADFRVNDRDGNHMNDYWTGDVAGLYGLDPLRPKIPAIELSIAAADGDPLQGVYPPIPALPSQKAGAWYQALNVDRSQSPPEPYRAPGRLFNTSFFGFIAYPDDYVAGLKYAFIVSERNTIYRRWLKDDIRASDRTPPGALKDPKFMDWPSDADLEAYWGKLD